MSFSSILQEVRSLPLLTVEQERELAALAATGDQEAAKKLALSFGRLAAKYAYKYGNAADIEDLFQEAMVGIMMSTSKLDHTKCERVSHYIDTYAERQVQEYWTNNRRQMRVITTKNARKVAFNLNRLMNKYGATKFNNKVAQLISAELDVPVEDVIDTYQRIVGQEISIHVDDSDEDFNYDPVHLNPQLWVTDTPETALLRKERSLEAVISAINELEDDRQREIIKRRWLAEEPANLADLAAEFNVSAERIRQIEKRGLDQLKRKFH